MGGVGFGGWVEGGQAGCERRIEVFVKIPKKNLGGGVGSAGGGVGGGRGRVGGRGGCERRIKFSGKFTQKKFFFGGEGEGVGRGVRWGVGLKGGGSGWM